MLLFRPLRGSIQEIFITHGVAMWSSRLGRSPSLPSHTTGHTDPYTAVSKNDGFISTQLLILDGTSSSFFHKWFVALILVPPFSEWVAVHELRISQLLFLQLFSFYKSCFLVLVFDSSLHRFVSPPYLLLWLVSPITMDSADFSLISMTPVEISMGKPFFMTFSLIPAASTWMDSV